MEELRELAEALEETERRELQQQEDIVPRVASTRRRRPRRRQQRCNSDGSASSGVEECRAGSSSVPRIHASTVSTDQTNDQILPQQQQCMNLTAQRRRLSFGVTVEHELSKCTNDSSFDVNQVMSSLPLSTYIARTSQPVDVESDSFAGNQY